jgi:hypothetical protein
MSKVFISYRRTDTHMAAGRLHDALSSRFGNDAIFRDKDSIAGGKDWIDTIEDSLKQDVVVLALIGSGWLSALNEAGTRRLDDPEDWNRRELENALRLDRTVVPVLVDDAQMPSAAQLPQSLQALTRTNAVKLRDDDWESDMEKLERVLSMHGLGAGEKAPAVRAPARASRRLIAAGIAAVVLGFAGAGAWFYTSAQSSPKSVSGTWNIVHFNEDGSKHAGTLILEQRARTLAGTVVWAPKATGQDISNGTVEGTMIEFEAMGPRGARRVYRGEVDSAGKLIQGGAQGGSRGQATWSAVRQTPVTP